MMFLLITSLLTAVLTLVVGSEYYSRLPTGEDKHLYEYGGDTDDIVQTNVDDSKFTIDLTHPIVFFGISYTSFEVSNSHLTLAFLCKNLDHKPQSINQATQILMVDNCLAALGLSVFAQVGGQCLL